MRLCSRISLCLLVAWGTALNLQAQSPANLLTRGGGIPCQIVMGRIQLNQQRGLTARSENIEHEPSRERQTLCIQTNAGQSVIRYEAHTAREHFALDFNSQGELRISQEQHDAAAPQRVVFVQSPGSDLRVEITQGKDRQEIQAATLWHLLLLEPEISTEHVLPLLARLHPDWKLAVQAKEVEQSLLQMAQTQDIPATKRTVALLTSLSATEFSQRQTAYRELRAIGPTLLPHLAQLDQRQFDAEQRKRVAELREELTSSTPDTPPRVARWLSGDQKLVDALKSKPVLP